MGTSGYCFAVTGLYHVGARAYDPRTARWLQRDPIDAASGDPSGLDWLDDTAHFAGG
jgi:RHS repeat-associated protein